MSITSSTLSRSSGQLFGEMFADTSIISANYAVNSIGTPHLANQAVGSAQVTSGISYHIEGFIGSAVSGFFSATWKTQFARTPAVNVTGWFISGQGSVINIITVTSALMNGQILRSGGALNPTSGAIHIIAIEK